MRTPPRVHSHGLGDTRARRHAALRKEVDVHGGAVPHVAVLGVLGLLPARRGADRGGVYAHLCHGASGLPVGSLTHSLPEGLSTTTTQYGFARDITVASLCVRALRVLPQAFDNVMPCRSTNRVLSPQVFFGFMMHLQ